MRGEGVSPRGAEFGSGEVVVFVILLYDPSFIFYLDVVCEIVSF